MVKISPTVEENPKKAPLSQKNQHKNIGDQKIELEERMLEAKNAYKKMLEVQKLLHDAYHDLQHK